MAGGQKVGTLVTASRLPGYNPAEALFLRRTNQGLLLAILAAMLVALLVGIVLANNLTHPLLMLTRAAENLAAGDLEQKVDIHSNDEIGELADAFNRMSQEVARVNQLRRQMTADVAHDLRTPLTVIAGYIESMRDGVLPPTQERLAIIYGEIERLQNLVGDLRTLSQADSGELVMNIQEVDLKALLERSAQAFQLRASQQGIRMSVDAPSNLPLAHLDQARMLQVLDNLLSNAFRYTPDGGEITISALHEGAMAVIKVIDNGSGIPEADLTHIFERFHRADPSRHTDTGESGLGLAIVRAIVEAHHGQVSAESALGHGTIIKIVLPF
jgi:signal transduction histidine kinase